MRKNPLIIILTVALLACEIPAAGSSGFTFLRLDTGARQAAMGSSGGSLTWDVTALSWNPAGLAFISRKEFFAQHTSWLLGTRHEYAAFGLKAGRSGGAAFSGTVMDYGEMDKRDALGNPAGSFGASDTAVSAGYGVDFGGFAAGGSVKAARGQIDGVTSGTAFGADAGILVYNREYSMGLVYQNAGTKVKYISEEHSLPGNLKIALGYRKRGRLAIGADCDIPSSGGFGISAGLEYSIRISRGFSLPVRVGYRTANDLGANAGFSFGSGAAIGGSSFDFAWAPYGDLGDTYRVSTRISFGKKPAAAESESADAGEENRNYDRLKAEIMKNISEGDREVVAVLPYLPYRSTDIFATKVAAGNLAKKLMAEQMFAVVSAAGRADAPDCSLPECVIGLARNLGAEKAVTVHVSDIGDGPVCVISVTDVDTGETVYNDSAHCDIEHESDIVLAGMAKKLAASIMVR